MKKLVIALALVAALATAVLVTGNALAQGRTPRDPQAPGWQMGGRGMHAGTGGGILHDAMIAVFAEELGISVDDLNARLASGETMAQIATESGLSVEEFRALMLDARSQAIDQAVEDGTLTQDQADWMKQRGGGMMAGRAGGSGYGRGMHGGLNCPYIDQTAP